MTDVDIEALFASTLEGEYDDDAPWDAVRTLRHLGPEEVFVRAVAWCESDDPLMRGRGVDVLAQLGKTAEHPSNRFPEKSYLVVSALVGRESDNRPVNSVISVLGHLDNADAVPLIAPFHTHPSPEIRFSVACSQGSYPNDDLSVETLLRLMEDADEDVRDWATFGLGVLGDHDSQTIRDAIYRRLSDTNEEVREEAMVGLGKRMDGRVLPLLLAALKGPTIKFRVAEAASLMLGMQNDRDDWGADEYCAALEARFPKSK